MTFRGNKISNIAKNIKEYRIREGMKQTEFAEMLGMNYQNYSKMERGVYTPSLDKLIEICSILQITPNDLLLEGREYDDYKKEIFENLDHSILNIIDTMKTVEELKAEALKAKLQKNEKDERYYLDRIIGIFAWRNEHYWNIADLLYQQRLNKLIKMASDRTSKQLFDKLVLDDINNLNK